MCTSGSCVELITCWHKVRLARFPASLDSADRHRRSPKTFQADHRLNALLHSPAVLLNQVVQIPGHR